MTNDKHTVNPSPVPETDLRAEIDEFEEKCATFILFDFKILTIAGLQDHIRAGLALMDEELKLCKSTRDDAILDRLDALSAKLMRHHQFMAYREHELVNKRAQYEKQQKDLKRELFRIRASEGRLKSEIARVGKRIENI